MNAAKLTPAECALLNAAATIGTIYEQAKLVSDLGHSPEACAAFFASLASNADRVEELVMAPAREAIGRIPQ